MSETIEEEAKQPVGTAREDVGEQTSEKSARGDGSGAECEREKAQGKTRARGWKRWLFSPTLSEKNESHKIAYIAIMTAFCVVANMLEIKLGSVQFSFTICISAFTGLVLGGGAGFCACFLGDLFGFLIHPYGAYSPWIGISTGCMALIVGEAAYLFGKTEKGLRGRLAWACLAIFLCCTSGITMLYLHLVYYAGMPYGEFWIYRLFVQGQIYNSILNSAIVIVGLPWVAKSRALRLVF